MSKNPVQDPNAPVAAPEVETASRFSRKTAAKWTAIGIFAAGTLLVVDDQVKKLRGIRPRKAKDAEETPTESTD